MSEVTSFESSVDPAAAAQHRYDVLVVGAGPAGSSAAYHLAHRGADVLLVDRLAFPRDKRCGDGIITAALAEDAMEFYMHTGHLLLLDIPVRRLPGRHATTQQPLKCCFKRAGPILFENP